MSTSPHTSFACLLHHMSQELSNESLVKQINLIEESIDDYLAFMSVIGKLVSRADIDFQEMPEGFELNLWHMLHTLGEFGHALNKIREEADFKGGLIEPKDQARGDLV